MTAGDLQAKVAIVTGASRGIGLAISQELARQGAAVVLSARDETRLAAAVAEIQENGGAAAWTALDLRQPNAPAQLAAFALATFQKIDILIHCAGATRRGDFLSLTDEDWADGYELKLFGAVRLTRAAWPQLKDSRGSVIFIAGSGGRTPGAQFALGGSVNAALLSLTKALAELGIADGVRVNAINPGAVRSDRFTRRRHQFANDHGLDIQHAEPAFIKAEKIVRIGEPQDVASLAAFLAGPAGSYLQGALIDIDGGSTKTI